MSADSYPNSLDKLQQVIATVREKHGADLVVTRNQIGNLSIFRDEMYIGFIDLGPNGPEWNSFIDDDDLSGT
jgi:hypothetical protein